jgi:hypothetical protein
MTRLHLRLRGSTVSTDVYAGLVPALAENLFDQTAINLQVFLEGGANGSADLNNLAVGAQRSIEPGGEFKQRVAIDPAAQQQHFIKAHACNFLVADGEVRLRIRNQLIVY